MRWTTACVLTAALLGLAGCGSKSEQMAVPTYDADSGFDTAMRTMWQVEMVDNAILRQRTLFPYQFVMNSSDLNDLGLRDIDVLSRHYRDHPGSLSVRQGGVDQALYDARVAAVVDAMSARGVDPERIEIADTLPGGDGITSDEVTIIWQDTLAPPDGGGTYQPTSGTGASSRTGN